MIKLSASLCRYATTGKGHPFADMGYFNYCSFYICYQQNTGMNMGLKWFKLLNNHSWVKVLEFMFCTDPRYTSLYYVKPNIAVLKRAWHLQPFHLNIKQHNQKRQRFMSWMPKTTPPKAQKSPKRWLVKLLCFSLGLKYITQQFYSRRLNQTTCIT